MTKMLCVPVGPLQANCYLVWDDERRACAIDPGGEPERLARLIEREALALDAILVTHGHFDHVQGVAGLAGATGAAVYCSSEAAGVLEGADECGATGMPVAEVASGAVREVTDGATIAVGRLTAKVIATPGHGAGDLTFEIDGSLFCGDLLFHGSVGRTDFPGGDFRALLASVAKLATRYPASTAVYPGHMDPTTLGEELAFNPFLRTLDSND
jgi:hydroxyacylglutathione hydrolase